MRATEFIRELFQPGKDWKWSFTGSEEAVAVFYVGGIPYKFYAFTDPVFFPGTWEVEFSSRTKADPGSSRDAKFGLTGTGNSAEVMSTIADIMREFLQRYQGSISQLSFTADEPSRQRLYARMAQRLLPNWEIVQSGKNFTLVAPETVSEDSEQPQSAGCIIVAEDTGRWCLQQRSDSVSDPGVWSTWGGGVNPGETLEQAVRRELAEEGGYRGDIVLELLHKTPAYATFIGRVPHEFKPQINHECKSWRWADQDQLPEPMHPGLVEALSKLSKSTQPLSESISSTVFHFTTIKPALNILRSGRFELSSSLGSIEQQYAPKGYPYFMSTTRTRRGGYHNIVGSTGVLFVLDGTWFNQRYPGGPVDYWENRNPATYSHREHEAEDRVFSREPTIPISGVTAVHVYVSPEADPEVNAWVRQTLIAAKRQGIPAQLYNNKDSWLNFDTRNTANVSQLKGQERTGGYVSGHRGYIMPWIELLLAKDQSQLSKRADNIRYSLSYSYDRDEAAKSLATDLSNARKPGSGPDRANAIKIIQYMQQNKLTSIKDFVDHLANRWKSRTTNENFADGKNPGRKGLSKRMNVPTKASVSKLRKIAKNSTGERQRMAHWLANMKAGRNKNK